MDYIGILSVIPPAKRLCIHTDCIKRRQSLFDLNLHSAVRQQERAAMVNQNFHGGDFIPPKRTGAMLF
jgi:hypothetical protein